jgi:hypothetical protein
LPPPDRLATLDNLSMFSFRKQHAHVTVIPLDGRQGYMSQLQLVGVVPVCLPCAPSGVVWLSRGRIVKASDLQRASIHDRCPHRSGHALPGDRRHRLAGEPARAPQRLGGAGPGHGQCRHYSQFLCLQLKVRSEELDGPV